MKKMWGAIGAMLVLGAMPVAAFAQSEQTSEQTSAQAGAEQRAYAAKVKAVLAKQRPQHGDIALPEAKAVLHLGQDYYYLDAAQAREVIVDMWGNPAAQADGVLGLVFPVGKTFVDDDAWGAVITYEQSGYVKDDDAASTDYDALMADMKSGEEANNKERAEAGYPAIQLVGWAERPAYDKAHHSVIWARDMRFGNAQDDTLNYDVRLLGRYGVLSLNMVSTMSQLPSVKAAATNFGASVSYDQGARYADYVPNVDKVAEYGIGGMIAAGAGLLAAKKLGLIALMLAFGKKLLIPIVLLFGGAWRWIKRRLGKAEEEPVYPADADDDIAQDTAVETPEPEQEMEQASKP